jgi:hypothetical protein
LRHHFHHWIRLFCFHVASCLLRSQYHTVVLVFCTHDTLKEPRGSSTSTIRDQAKFATNKPIKILLFHHGLFPSTRNNPLIFLLFFFFFASLFAPLYGISQIRRHCDTPFWSLYLLFCVRLDTNSVLQPCHNKKIGRNQYCSRYFYFSFPLNSFLHLA